MSGPVTTFSVRCRWCEERFTCWEDLKRHCLAAHARAARKVILWAAEGQRAKAVTP